MAHYLQRLLFGLAYIAPIGLQNLFVINTALAQPRWRALRVAVIVTFFDISLALATFYGVGKLLTWLPWLKMVVLGVGSLIVLYIGISLLRAQVPQLKKSAPPQFSYWRATLAAFAIAWLNPQALLDGTVTIRGVPCFVGAVSGQFFYCWRYDGISCLVHWVDATNCLVARPFHD
ncbi:LysE/ArgO family amino acid transporter [Loigolactobacillus coryniformis]|jgi:L-lysine exporter family protein LysE/ArgO|uniref:LysE/ArgO family amino acid transporter n=1 Tax=Loigolactobacillus coryniformis TaxID=1610 RepID=UPI0002195422|nr:LysE family transporter [Loigolactobacillus coryniformis]KRK72696.1 amino acid efflux protein [Loigolactobacillus coryniformis subsp. torquens DSM 20004 = KCTC 3535]MCL5459194.1 LysE family transporter [Loigolactobacillus coryniformis]